MATAKKKKSPVPAVAPVDGDVAAAEAAAEAAATSEEEAEASAAAELIDEMGGHGVAPIVTYRITSRRAGFWRAGRQWSTTPTDVPASDLSDVQIAMLLDEPLLTVEELS